MGNTPAPLIRASANDALKAVAASGGAKRVPRPLQWNPSKHLLSRFANGPWGNEVSGNPDTWFANQIQLGLANPGYSGVPGLVTRYPYLARTSAQTKLALTAEGNSFGATAMDQLSRATLMLKAWSPAQLFETTVDYFANRLHVANYSDSVQANRVSYDRDVIRKFAFGKYRDMLLAAEKHPAMLTFFTANGSSFMAPNENLGREILELHTVGRDAGYTQADVVANARLMTGRGYEGRFGDYQWSNGYHDINPVAIMDWSHPNDSAAGGEEAGDQFLAWLASHPATANSVAKGLCTHFVSDTPSDELVAAVADAYLQNDTAIIPMLQTIVRSTEFWDSRGAKFRRPQENLAATIRLFKINFVDIEGAASQLQMWANAAGHKPLAYSGAMGYPDVAPTWLSASGLLRVWTNQVSLVKGFVTAGFTKPADADVYGGTAPASSGPAIEMVFRNLTGVSPQPAETSAIYSYLGESGDTSMTKSKMRTNYLDVAALILRTAHHQMY